MNIAKESKRVIHIHFVESERNLINWLDDKKKTIKNMTLVEYIKDLIAKDYEEASKLKVDGSI